MPPCRFSAGIDASDFDWGRGPMDLAAAVRDGISFFTHKATEGTSVKHVRYKEAMRRARDAGIPVLGAYHVVRSPRNAQAEVNYFLAYLDAQTPWWRTHPAFFIQVDLEKWPYDSVPAAEGEDFADLAEAQTGKTAIIYASRGQYGHALRGTSHELWNANYPLSYTAGDFRDLYRRAGGDNGPGWTSYSGKTPAIWQYTSSAVIGRQPTCDANAYRGTLADLRALITGNTGTGDDEMKAVLVRAKGDGRVYLSNGVTRWWVPTEAVLADIQGGVNTLLGHLVTPTVQVVDDIDAFGVEVPAGLATRLDGMTSGGAPTQDQVNVAVAEAMKDPEVQKGIGDAIASHLHVS